tara:strand:- start:2769 stop:4076 length:1308 start_codon:yes stop_codon:yes gene_type:complete
MDITSEFKFYLNKLFPMNRSLTGEQNRETLKIIKDIIPIKVHEYSSGSKVFDWVIPEEWNVVEAWVKNSKGEKVIDFNNSNLHLVSYSEPIQKKVSLEELQKKLHFLEQIPEAIPYRTSYYSKDWGFCLSYNDYIGKVINNPGDFEIFIDCNFKKGGLSIGEILIPGRNQKEILISCYICHPSMANDSLSGVLITAFLARELLKIQKDLEHSYRIVFVPETIGAIAYSYYNLEKMRKIERGLVITTCGGKGRLGYKRAKDGDDFINQMTEDVFYENGDEFLTYDFDINGSDERQYSSIGIGINCVTITKDKYYEYNYYHTSLDNLDFVLPENLKKTFDRYLQLINKLDKNIVYTNLKPYGEIMLSKYNLFSGDGGSFLPSMKLTEKEIILWLMHLCDGEMPLYMIAKKINVKLEELYAIAKKLEMENILRVELDL